MASERIKTIGNPEEIQIIIDRSGEKDPNSYFARITLIINSHTLKVERESNLSLLCVQFEALPYVRETNRLKFYERMECRNNNYLWSLSESELLRLWNKYFALRRIQIVEDKEVEDFETALFKAKLPFDSAFADEFMFLGCSDNTYWKLKVWQNYADEVFDFKVREDEFFRFLEDTATYLRSEVLL